MCWFSKSKIHFEAKLFILASKNTFFDVERYENAFFDMSLSMGGLFCMRYFSGRNISDRMM